MVALILASISYFMGLRCTNGTLEEWSKKPDVEFVAIRMRFGKYACFILMINLFHDSQRLSPKIY